MTSSSLDDLSMMKPAALRQILAPWLGGTVTEACRDAVTRAVADLVDATSDGQLRRSLAAMASVGQDYRPYDADPFARRLSRAYIQPLLLPGSAAAGVANLSTALARGPTLLLGNHRSYVDTQLTDALLWRVQPHLADCLATVAGPKVYADAFRRIAALGLHTIKTAQSTSVASEGVTMSVREVARIAGQTMAQAHALMSSGHAVLLYAEGRRSRDGQLGPFLRAVARYGRLSGTHVVPVALSGSQRVFPVDAKQLTPAVVTLQFGQPIAAAGLARDDILAQARGSILDMLGG